jgi:hypothetical protein
LSRRSIRTEQLSGANDVKLPSAMKGPKTTAGKGLFWMAKAVAGTLRLIAELRPRPGLNIKFLSKSRVGSSLSRYKVAVWQ